MRRRRISSSKRSKQFSNVAKKVHRVNEIRSFRGGTRL